MAVRRHKVVLQNAEYFFKWGKGQESSNLKYICVDKSDEAKLEISDMTVKPIKGILQIHAVVPLGDGKIATRETSCYCCENASVVVNLILVVLNGKGKYSFLKTVLLIYLKKMPM
jgi:hypothetical protein